MTKLPATVETEALAFACQEIALFRDNASPWSDRSSLTAEASRAFVRHIMRLAALSHPARMLQVIEIARSGEADADSVLRELAMEFIYRHEPMPDPLGT
jgi:hypothetical protein